MLLASAFPPAMPGHRNRRRKAGEASRAACGGGR